MNDEIIKQQPKGFMCDDCGAVFAKLDLEANYNDCVNCCEFTSPIRVFIIPEILLKSSLAQNKEEVKLPNSSSSSQANEDS